MDKARSQNYYQPTGAYGNEPAPAFDSLMKMSPLEPRIQKHVARVYTTLTTALLASAAGAMLQVRTGNALPAWLCTVLTVASLIYFSALSQDSANPTKRAIAMHAVSAAMGTSLGPLLGFALDVSSGLVLVAVLTTATVFACFSGAAILARRRSYLYLGGTLATCTSVLFWSGLIARFYPSLFVFNLQLYMGLFVFCGYVVYDTQKIIEKAAVGRMDHLRDALDLFVDFFAIFVRVLIILLKNQEKKKERRR